MGVFMLMLGLAILIYMTVRGINIIVSAIIASVFVAITSGQDVVEAMTGTYMNGFTGYFASYFLLFLLGAVFGKVMGKRGCRIYCNLGHEGNWTKRRCHGCSFSLCHYDLWWGVIVCSWFCRVSFGSFFV